MKSLASKLVCIQCNYLSNLSSELTYGFHMVRIFQKYLSPGPILTTVYLCLSNSVLFQHQVAYITTLVFFCSLSPLSRRVQSIYCCFILSQTHLIITLPSLGQVWYCAPPSPSAANLDQTQISCRLTPVIAPHQFPTLKGVRWNGRGHRQLEELHYCYSSTFKVSTSSLLISSRLREYS